MNKIFYTFYLSKTIEINYLISWHINRIVQRTLKLIKRIVYVWIAFAMDLFHLWFKTQMTSHYTLSWARQRVHLQRYEELLSPTYYVIPSFIRPTCHKQLWIHITSHPIAKLIWGVISKCNYALNINSVTWLL